MLKKRDLSDCGILFELLQDPAVFPYVRQKADSLDTFLFLTKQTIESEDAGTMISRTIMNEWGAPIGTITLFDIENGHGFLGTWIGKPYFGKGYNQKAKEAFFTEIFLEHGIETVFMKIRTANVRSIKAAGKLSYVSIADQRFPDVYRKINPSEKTYHLFAVTKESFFSCRETIEPFPPVSDHDTLKEA
ncbi:GNAT family N-acetyltransferase [Sporolactobacillus putidus]|uniref:Alanine acetyltransferase n=1 Tax=Sporolactobacillus putidus TaxID=492735 RepID=A0A917S8V2_9BACL|nr:GNAT family protein [Sporolactobacillus putidus]GGL64738.1 alanine acetyltransferase [Sporolactobacillus putidus]